MSQRPASSPEGSESSRVCAHLLKARGWSTGESQVKNYTHISLGGECGKQDSNQTRPQIAGAWVSSGPESWLRYCLSLQAQLPGLRAECGLLTRAPGFLLFT